jgi:hypothetical protein
LAVPHRSGEAGPELADSVGIGHHIDIVEAVERHVQLLDEG